MSIDPERETTDEAGDPLESAEDGAPEDELGDAGRSKGAAFIDPTTGL